MKGRRSSVAPISAYDQQKVQTQVFKIRALNPNVKHRACSMKGVRCMKGRTSSAAPISACD